MSEKKKLNFVYFSLLIKTRKRKDNLILTKTIQ